MTAFQWVQVIFMIVLTVCVPLLLWTWRTGHSLGRKEQKAEAESKNISDLTERIKVEIRRFDSMNEEKADAKQLLALEQRIDMRLGYVEKRLAEIVAHTDKRFDDGSERMSKISGKITEVVDNFRNDLGILRERCARFEERLDERTNNGNHGRRETDR